MTALQFLDVGSKLIGLYFVVLTLPILLSVAIGWLFSNHWEQVGGTPIRIYIAISISGLVVLIVFGWALIKGSGFVLRNVFGQEREPSERNVKDTFTIGVKLFGAFTAMAEFLSFVKLLSNFTMVSSLFSASASIPESIGIATNFMPPLISALLGLLLFFRGELLSSWAFAERKVAEPN